MKHLGDITKIHGDKVPRVTIITGGSPCQDLSVAGKRAGLAGERSGLYMDQIRIIKEMRKQSEQELRDSGADFDIRLVAPRYMVWENVPGALSSGTPKGADFQAVLEEAAKVVDKTAVIPGPADGKWPSAGCIVADGWSIAWRIHDAQWWGVAQRRKRICMLCDFNGQTAGEILFELQRKTDGAGNHEVDEHFGAESEPEIHAVAESLPGNPEPGGKAGQGAARSIAEGISDSSYTIKVRGGAEFDRFGRRAGKGALVQTELSGTLGVSQDQTLVEVYGMNRERCGAIVGEDIMPTMQAAAGESGNNKPMVCMAFEPGAASRIGGHYSDDVAGTVRSNAGDNQQAVCYGIDQQGGKGMAGYAENVSPTIASDSHGTPHAVCYGISSDGSNAMLSDNPKSGIYEAETSRTLDLNGGSPACNQGGIAVVQGVDIYNGAVTGDIAASLTANGTSHAGGTGPKVLVQKDEKAEVVAGLREIADFLDSDDKAIVHRAIELICCIEGNGARESHRGKGYVESETMFTLNTVEQHAVAYRKTSHAKSAEDGQGWQETEVNDTVNAFDNGESRTPTLVVDQGAGKSQCSISAEVSPTLATTHGGEPVVLENHPADSRVKISENGVAQTLSSRMGTGGGNVPMVMEPVILESNQNHARASEDGIAPTLPASMGAGGGYVPMIAATRSAVDKGVHSQMLSNPEENFVVGPVAATSKASYMTNAITDGNANTLVATDWKDPQVVAYEKKNKSGQYGEGVGTLRASGGDLGGGSDPLCTYQNVTETLCAAISKGTSNQIAADDMLVANPVSVVRRLTPLECERLQGFPDFWTSIGDWTDTKGKLHKGDFDSPRYKALGNSIALPFWRWLAKRMAAVLRLEGYKNLTMASLFDGIGGFPLVFSEVGVKPVWASEIEEFPIAVTKLRFKEEEDGAEQKRDPEGSL